ncbi:MAG TPA: hypothetical protein VEF71_16285 [Streptosporangiaceae bacterium]|jgi:hypothetical protein|nr:hypothetical protein [Streptosporangiaceae bacterium]
MSTTEVRGEIPLEEIQRTLSEALGHGYKVTATSDSTLKIRRAPLVTATVNVKWYEDGTTLQVAPGEAWILQGINALTIYPKVRHTVSRAFPAAA